MILVQNTILSDDIAEKFFVCHLEKCKGACCVEGDAGAPLEESELPVLDQIYEQVKPYLSPEGIAAIEAQGRYVVDQDGDWATPMMTAAAGACAYTTHDAQGHLKCGIEQAYLDGKTDFRKPISCHLYPIRITKYDEFEAINYHRWDICSPACSLGEALGVELYKFLEAPLVRRYGQAWYNELVQEIEDRKAQ